MTTRAPETILLVDDEAVNLSVLFDQLREAGYKVLIKETGASALRGVQLSRPDIVLLDIKLPDIDGFEVCRRLKADAETRDIPILFISSAVEMDDKVQGFAAGGVDYITKPFQIEEVLARVRTHLDLSRLRRQLQTRNAQMQEEIAERRRTEQELRKLSRAVEQTASPVVISDPRGLIEFVNPAFSRVTGYTPAEAAGQNPRVLKSGQHPPEFYQHLWHTLLAGDTWQGELNNRRKDGSLYWESATISPVKDDEGRTTHYVAVKEDITRQKEAEEELKRLNQELQEANASKDRFFSIIAHDLRSPFTALLGMTDIVVQYFDELPAEELKANLLHIKGSAETVYDLLENLLTWSRIQRGVMQPDLQHLRLGPVVEHVIALSAAHAAQKRTRVTRHIPDDLVVQADADMLSAVIRNLLSNALKFTPSGGQVDISARADGQTIDLAVADTGTGIDPDRLATIFQMTSSANSLGTAGEKGTGLGLPLCKDLMEQQGGRIRAASEAGRGTTFTCTFRAGEMAHDDAARPADESRFEPSFEEQTDDTAADLDDLPEPLYLRLKDAIEAVNIETSLALADQIEPQHAALARRLRDLITGYRFDVLQAMVTRERDAP